MDHIRMGYFMGNEVEHNFVPFLPNIDFFRFIIIFSLRKKKILKFFFHFESYQEQRPLIYF